MTSTDTLLPCPFCGNTDTTETSGAAGRWLICNCCEMAGPVSRVDARAAWNRRTPPTPATDAREAVARALCIAGEEDDFNYKGYLELADAALSALAPIRAAEILAAEANERARIVALVRQHAKSQRLDGLRCVLELSANAIEHGAGK